MNHLKNNADKPAMPTVKGYGNQIGITKREHFAYGAMVALITHYGLYHEQNTLKEKSWEIADLMLKEGQK
jgi:hypothetical protein